MFLIGLGHRSGHGKDTAANFIVDWFHAHNPTLRVRKQSFAWKLKDICHQLYGHLGLREPEFYETPAGREARNVRLPRIGKTPVEIWIDFGTPAVRHQVWDQTWIDYVRNINDVDVVVVPDVRFANEAAVCDYTIKVVNPFIPDREGKSVDEELADWQGWNAEFVNDLDLCDLQSIVVCWAWQAFPRKNIDRRYIQAFANAGLKRICGHDFLN